MKAAEIMAAIYWGILKRIQKRCYNVFGKRVRVPRAAEALDGVYGLPRCGVA